MAGVWTLREFSVPPAAVSGNFYYQGRLRAPSTFLRFPPGTETPGPLQTLPGDVRAWSRSLSMELYPWVYCHPTDEQSAGQWDHASAGVYEPQPLVLPEPRRPPPSSRQHPSPAVFPPHGREGDRSSEHTWLSVLNTLGSKCLNWGDLEKHALKY